MKRKQTFRRINLWLSLSFLFSHSFASLDARARRDEKHRKYFEVGADFQTHRRKRKKEKETRENGKKKESANEKGFFFHPLSRAPRSSSFFHLHSISFSLLLLAQHVGDLLALGLAARVRPELLLREPQRALLAARLEQLADAALVGGEAGDLADDLADDLDALGGALFVVVEKFLGVGWWWREGRRW